MPMKMPLALLIKCMKMPNQMLRKKTLRKEDFDHLVDFGHNYFLARFELNEDFDHVLKNGLWFIGQHFLAIKSWEPKFKASTTSFSEVAIWICLPELPIEFYDLIILKKDRLHN